MKPLVIIPARGGSKRIPRKNIKLFRGKPLIYYTIEAAREIFDDSIICVSTDDLEIRQITERIGLNVPFTRPKRLAADTSDSRSVLLHAYNYYLEEKEYVSDTIILLQPTSPLRNSSHIREALELYHENIDMVVSVNEADSTISKNTFIENVDGYLQSANNMSFSRGNSRKVWALNGAIYIIKATSLCKGQINDFEKILKYQMKPEVSIDVDTYEDWTKLEAMP